MKIFSSCFGGRNIHPGIGSGRFQIGSVLKSIRALFRRTFAFFSFSAHPRERDIAKERDIVIIPTPSQPAPLRTVAETIDEPIPPVVPDLPADDATASVDEPVVPSLQKEEDSVPIEQNVVVSIPSQLVVEELEGSEHEPEDLEFGVLDLITNGSNETVTVIKHIENLSEIMQSILDEGEPVVAPVVANLVAGGPLSVASGMQTVGGTLISAIINEGGSRIEGQNMAALYNKPCYSILEILKEGETLSYSGILSGLASAFVHTKSVPLEKLTERDREGLKKLGFKFETASGYCLYVYHLNTSIELSKLKGMTERARGLLADAELFILCAFDRAYNKVSAYTDPRGLT